MPRLGLALRLSALMALALALIVATFGGALYLQRLADSGEGWRPPFPAQLTAIVELIETTAPAELPRLQQALDTPGLRLRVTPGPWQDRQPGVALPRLAAITQRYLDTLGGRRLRMEIGGPGKGRLAALLGADGLRPGRPLEVQVELRDGRVLELELRAPLLGRLIARPLALLVMLLLVLIGLISLWGLWRQIRPLQELARAVERFGSGDEAPLRETGAAEVRQLIAAFNRLRGRIDELLQGRTRMLAAISHDLGTYLTRLRLRIEQLDEEVQRQRAEQDIEAMHRLLRDTLALARTDSPAVTLQPVDLAALAAREVRACAEAGAKAVFTAAPPLWIDADATALTRVLSNLIANALRYGGRAEVWLDREPGWAQLCVADRGPGIPAGERAAVFEPFYRRDRSRNLDDGGCGLGLAIVASIVRGHRGEVLLEDRVGGGLCVRVRLPLSAPPRPAGAGAA